jgi:copper chaperone
MIKSALVAAGLAAALLVSVPAPSAYACDGHGKGTAAGAKKDRPAKVATASFKVDGMHCAGCSDKVTAKLNAQDGVVSVKVALADKRVTVEYDPAKLDAGKIAKIITEVGYAATAEV